MFSAGVLLICWLRVYKNTVRQKYAFPDKIEKLDCGKCTLLSTLAPKSVQEMSHLKVISPSNEEHCSCHYFWHLMHCIQFCVLGSSYFSLHPGQKMFLLSAFFFSE